MKPQLCERCQQQPISEDGLCQVCYLIVVQDPKYRPTQGELVEDQLSGLVRVMRSAQAARRAYHTGGAR